MPAPGEAPARRRDLAADLQRDGIGLVVARLKSPVDERIAAAGLDEAIGVDRFHPTIRAAVAACLDEGGSDPG